MLRKRHDLNVQPRHEARGGKMNKTVNPAYNSVLISAAVALLAAATATASGEPMVTASGLAAGFQAAGAVDGDRFSCAARSVWKGNGGPGWWQIRFAQPRPIGAILQINGDHEYRLQNAPRNYVWQWSRDGESWSNIGETVVHQEKRLFRIHRLKEPRRVEYLRLNIYLSEGAAPALREVEFYAATDTRIEFADWIIAVNSAEDRRRQDVGTRFVQLARQCEGWHDLPAQLIWHGDFDQEFISTEPQPMCAFFSGSFLEWCQRSREPLRGVQQVLKSRSLPMWAACGGAGPGHSGRDRRGPPVGLSTLPGCEESESANLLAHRPHRPGALWRLQQKSRGTR